MIIYLIAWVICILIGALVSAIKSEGDNKWILIGSIGTAIISGIFLLIIWATITISQYFGIPLLVVIAVIILLWFLLGSISDKR